MRRQKRISCYLPSVCRSGDRVNPLGEHRLQGTRISLEALGAFDSRVNFAKHNKINRLGEKRLGASLQRLALGLSISICSDHNYRDVGTMESWATLASANGGIVTTHSSRPQVDSTLVFCWSRLDCSFSLHVELGDCCFSSLTKTREDIEQKGKFLVATLREHGHRAAVHWLEQRPHAALNCRQRSDQHLAPVTGMSISAGEACPL